MDKTTGILAIDDNKKILESLELFLGRHFFNVFTVSSPKNLFSVLHENEIHVVLMDMNLAPGRQSGNEGLFWLNEIKTKYPCIVVILITAYGDIELAVEGMKRGAFDFILKPWDNDKLLNAIKAATRYAKTQKELGIQKEPIEILKDDTPKNQELYIGKSAAMQKVMKIIEKSAPTDANILLLGENGIGKEILAREIHEKSLRKNQVFFPVDMASIPGSLFESELFGHEKGAFTDAKDAKTGKIEASNGGTLFIDEIGELPIHLQTKLLSVIQTKTLTPIGSSKTKKVDFRLVSATNRQLDNMVKTGEFREDLLYRLNTITIQIPPLRERSEDIPALIKKFLETFSKQYNKQGLSITKAAIKKLTEYQWPGNIRELKHTMEKLTILYDEKIEASNVEMNKNASAPGSLGVYNLEELEKQTIRKVIDVCNGNMSHAAKKLGISRNTLYAKKEKYGL